MEVACGQCLGCRVRRSQEWAARIVHEAQMHQDNCFVTLTYDNDHLPHDGSLNKAHFQKFMKRLRRQNETKTIRYFHCGEYGEELRRPHYHACIFGHDFSDREPYSSSNGVVVDISPELEKTWGMGFCTVGELNYQSAAYTARYVMKKVTGIRAEEHYEWVDQWGEVHKLQPEYITMSLGRNRGEGIGGSFFEKYKADFQDGTTPVPGKGVHHGIPKYYESLLQETDPDTFEKIKRARKKYRDSHENEYTAKRLETKYHVKKAQLSQLKRS